MVLIPACLHDGHGHATSAQRLHAFPLPPPCPAPQICHLETTQAKVLTLKMDLKYWPTWELVLDKSTCTWSRRQISPLMK